MSKSRALKALAITVFVSGISDAIGGLTYLVLFGRGTGDPPTHPFHAIFIASLLFCFAYLLIMSAFNIRRYLLILGAVIIGRMWYAVQFFAFMLVVPDFPSTFWMTGLLDLLWCILYLVFTYMSDEVRVKELFLPHREVS